MRRNAVILLCAASTFFTALLGAMGCSGAAAPEVSDITSFSYSESGGMTANYGFDYQAATLNGSELITVRPFDCPPEETVSFEPDTPVLSRLRAIVEKYGMAEWNGFDRTNSNALDGHSFSIKVEMDNGESISARGYMSWPKNFAEATDEIEALFTELYDAYLASE